MKPLSSSQKRFLILGVFAALIMILGAGAWLVNDVYAKRAEGGFVRFISPLLPAARVGSRVISYRQFLDTRDTVRVYMQSDTARQIGLAQPVTADVEQNAFERLVREAVIDETAKARNVNVTDEDVRAAFAAITESTSSTIPDVGAYLAKSFNWNEDQFRAKVVRPALLEEKLIETFVSSSTVDPAMAWEDFMTARLAKPDVKIYLKFQS